MLVSSPSSLRFFLPLHFPSLSFFFLVCSQLKPYVAARSMPKGRRVPDWAAAAAAAPAATSEPAATGAELR